MTHDEKKYPSPDEFKPERFLHEDGSLTGDTMPLGFGWGRRIWWVAILILCSPLQVACQRGTISRGRSTLDRDDQFPCYFLSPESCRWARKGDPIRSEVRRWPHIVRMFSFPYEQRADIFFFSHPENFPCRIVPRIRDASAERLTQLASVGL